MAKKKIIILGAGLAGLSAAWHLQRKGIDCLIFEKESQVGGLCRSKKIGDFIFDYDGHILHFRHRYTFNLVRGLFKNNLIRRKRNAWIYSYRSYTRYPFQANLWGLPPFVIKDCLLGAIKASYNGRLPKNPTFLDWIEHRFGDGIAQHFMVPYNTKFWTLPPQKLTCEWLDGFIPVPSLSQIIDGTVEESKRQFGYNAYFWYPKEGGIGRLAEAFASQIKNIHTNCAVKEIDLSSKRLRLNSGVKERFDYLISTIPLPELPFMVKGMPKEIVSLFKKLKWNSIFNLNLGISRRIDSPMHWIYFPHPDTYFFRVGLFHNFSESVAPLDKSSFYIEVAYSKYKPIDKSTIILKIKQDLIKIGLINHNDKVCAEDINDIKYGYPIYDKSYSQTTREIKGYLLNRTVLTCGRYGSWRYFSMEDAIVDGKRISSLF
ncbi:MAG: FAD-dependent oxidoreductase [Candidatus Omnitrophica bacterium]|nr:FAD-dependent oxidoreductase [Candidatus Omnitrophota bacterium]